MPFLRRSLACGLITLAAAAFSPAASAQGTTYAYSVALTVTAPKGSASEAVSKNKTLPAGIKFSPCDASALDQLAFTIKYDAGKPGVGTTPSTLQNVYVIFNRDGGLFFPLVRNPLMTTGAIFKVYPASGNIQAADTYTAVGDNLGGAQTEVILGGNLTVHGLDSGVWLLTAIIAPAATVNFDDPRTWSAWDTVPFMLRKPWKGIITNSCD
ncbi:hypothetical protein HNP48_004165 [Acidovorax soli]|uniref:Uncharacterized protein n=1 Tax=Acidovorax soli TaxID=592050 RepID=A0A7X0PH49_9BURK|nr:hypothetical protein [Acidovorax soli]MBB6561472.1 hypothetical protein [Acidovorax soli]